MVKLVLVDKNDKELGIGDKLKSHLGKGILHRAFTIFISNNKGEVLIQKRAKEKLLWPLVWEASCSSHPLPKESYEEAGEKRLKKELGFTCKLKNVGAFVYEAKYKNIGTEKEYCALLMGEYNGAIKPNKKEIAEWRWISVKDLKKEFGKFPKKYAPWTKPALKIHGNN